MSEARRKEIEKILDRDHRSSLKWWNANLATVREGLRTGIQVDGTIMTEEDRAVHEGIEGFILDNIHMIEQHIEGLIDFGDIAIKSISAWMSGVDEDAILKEFTVESNKLTEIMNKEENVRKKWI